MADNSEEEMANNSERDTDISFGGSWFVMSMLIRKWIEKWRSYRYRFVPWIALNLRKRCDFTWLNINIIFTVTWRHPNPSPLYVTLFFLCPARLRLGVFTFAMVVSHWSNFRIPRNLFTCHWIRIASIVLCLDLQSLPTHVNELRGILKFSPVTLLGSCKYV